MIATITDAIRTVDLPRIYLLEPACGKVALSLTYTVARLNATAPASGALGGSKPSDSPGCCSCRSRYSFNAVLNEIPGRSLKALSSRDGRISTTFHRSGSAPTGAHPQV